MPGPFETMVNACSIPVGTAGSLFQTPNTAATTAAADMQYSLQGLFAAPSGLDDVASPLGAFANLTAGVTSYAVEKLEKIVTELPVLNAAIGVKSKIKAIDAIATHDGAGLTDIINKAFLTSSASFPDLTGSSGPFGALTTGSNAALTGATSTTTTALGALSPSSITAISGLMGLPPAANLTALMAQLKTRSPGQLATLQAAIALDPIITGELTTAGASMVSGIATHKSTFTSAVTTSEGSTQGMFKMMSGSNFLNLLQSKQPGVLSVLSSTINPASIDSQALAIAERPSAYKIPAKTAVSTVNTEKPLAERPIESPTKEPGPPASVPDKYTQAEIDAFKATVLGTYYDPLQTLKAAAAAEVKTIEEWKLTNDYAKKQVAAGATVANPGGTSTDSGILAAWNAVYSAYIPQRDHYNNVTLPPLTTAENLYKAVYLEYNRRRAFGKHPYTTMEAQGLPVAPASKTTYLDSTL